MTGMLPEKCESVLDAVGVATAYCNMVANWHYSKGDKQEWRRWKDRAGKLTTHWTLKGLGRMARRESVDELSPIEWQTLQILALEGDDIRFDEEEYKRACRDLHKRGLCSSMRWDAGRDYWGINDAGKEFLAKHTHSSEG